MIPTTSAWLQSVQQRHGDTLLTVLMVLLLLLLFVLVPLQAMNLPGIRVLSGLDLLAILGCALCASGNVAASAIMGVGLAINLVVLALRVIAPSRLDTVLLSISWLMVAATLVWLVAKLVFFNSGRVTPHRIIGAVLLYLLIATAFVAVYALLGTLIPGAFNGLTIEDSPRLASSLVYFSFVTLTSTGFGDVVPVHPLARSLCNLETIIGQLYPATLLARLVTLELEGRG